MVIRGAVPGGGWSTEGRYWGVVNKGAILGGGGQQRGGIGGGDGVVNRGAVLGGGAVLLVPCPLLADHETHSLFLILIMKLNPFLISYKIYVVFVLTL